MNPKQRAIQSASMVSVHHGRHKYIAHKNGCRNIGCDRCIELETKYKAAINKHKEVMKYYEIKD